MIIRLEDLWARPGIHWVRGFGGLRRRNFALLARRDANMCLRVRPIQINEVVKCDSYSEQTMINVASKIEEQSPEYWRSKW